MHAIMLQLKQIKFTFVDRVCSLVTEVLVSNSLNWLHGVIRNRIMHMVN